MPEPNAHLLFLQKRRQARTQRFHNSAIMRIQREDSYAIYGTILAEQNRNDGESAFGAIPNATIDAINRRSHDNLKQHSAIAQFVVCSNKSGRVVTFPDHLSNVPVLTGNDGNPVLLYKIVEEIEEIIDPAELQAQFATLSYTQIVGAMVFLRKIAQINSQNLDLDEVEDASIEKSEEFQKMMTNSLQDKEYRIVHTTE